MRFSAGVLLGAFMCAGCAPLPFTVASMLADGVSYAATDKSLTDHGLSALSEKDCAMYRLLTDGIVCREHQGEVVVATADTDEPAPPEPEVRQIASPSGNVAVPQAKLKTEPVPGIYMVIASSRDLVTAQTYKIRNPEMSPQVFPMPAGRHNVIYHIVVGPLLKESYDAARRNAAAHGFKNTWAVRIDAKDRKRAEELKQVAQPKLSAQNEDRLH